MTTSLGRPSLGFVLSLPLSLSVSDCVTVTVCACQVAIETGGIWVCVAHIQRIPYMTSDFHLSENICFQNTTRGRSGVQKYGRTDRRMDGEPSSTSWPRRETEFTHELQSVLPPLPVPLSLSLSLAICLMALSAIDFHSVCVPVFR